MLPPKSRDYSPHNLARVRHLRSNMTGGEQILWSRLKAKKLGFQFRRQHPLGPYVLDFYCPEARLCVEVDGEQHLPEVNAVRGKALAELGIETFRIHSWTLFDEHQLRQHVENVLATCVRLTGRDPFQDSPGTAP